MAYAKGKIQVNIWPTAEEHEVLRRRAQALGISLQAYCLNMAVNGRIPAAIANPAHEAQVIEDQHADA